MKKTLGGSLLLILNIIISSCASNTEKQYQQTGGVNTIPLPPQRLGNQNTAPPVLNQAAPQPKQTASGTAKQVQKNANQDNPESPYPKRIQEDRSNGSVTQIKVENKDLPPYYIYPSKTPDQSGRNTTDTSISTPSWQINW